MMKNEIKNTKGKFINYYFYLSGRTFSIKIKNLRLLYGLDRNRHRISLKIAVPKSEKRTPSQIILKDFANFEGRAILRNTSERLRLTQDFS